MSYFGTVARRTIRAMGQRNRDLASKKAANAAYASIVAKRPENALSDADRQQIRAYSREVLGSVRYSPWLEMMTAWRGEWHEGWLVANYVEDYLTTFWNGPHKSILNNVNARRTLECDLIPDVGYVLNGDLYDVDFQPLDVEAFQRQAFAENDYLYLKHTSTVQGLGVSRVSAGEFAGKVAGLRSAALQSPVEVHPDLAALSPTAAFTIRITTAHGGAAPKAVAAHVRFAPRGATHITSTSRSMLGADIKTGKLFPWAATGDWTPFERHPETGQLFRESEIPWIPQIGALCASLHARVPQIRCIGWDATVTPEGDIRIFEANAGHPAVDLTEACFGPSFREFGWDKLHHTMRRYS